jgi:acyl-ACP thioesterase
MEDHSHQTATFRVYWHDTDKNGRMSFAAISRYLQETAWQQAEKLGFGYENAKVLNQFWVLVRQRIVMHRFPRWNDIITIETWPRGVEGILAFRDYHIRDEDRHIVGGVASSWMVVDLNTRRPQKPELVKGALSYIDPSMALKEPPAKIIFGTGDQYIETRKVKFSDMDLNGHVTNSKYTEWIFDALSAEKTLRNFKHFHINFIAEAKEGDIITISELNLEDQVKIKATRVTDGRTIFIAELD